jgi:hypothetical protein
LKKSENLLKGNSQLYNESIEDDGLNFQSVNTSQQNEVQIISNVSVFNPFQECENKNEKGNKFSTIDNDNLKRKRNKLQENKDNSNNDASPVKVINNINDKIYKIEKDQSNLVKSFNKNVEKLNMKNSSQNNEFLIPSKTVDNNCNKLTTPKDIWDETPDTNKKLNNNSPSSFTLKAD